MKRDANENEKFLIRYGESETSNHVAKCVSQEIALEMTKLLNNGVKYESLLEKCRHALKISDAINIIEELSKEANT